MGQSAHTLLGLHALMARRCQTVRLRSVAGLLAAHLAIWLALPEPLYAWGPGTHIALGEMVLGALHLLPPAVRALIDAWPIHYLYGSVAPDISFAKKYVPQGRHCHNWHVGEEIYRTAETDALRAVGLGYLSHLAADTIAHNLYVPRQLLLTSTTAAIGHTYWEHRMDVHLGRDFIDKSQRLVLGHDHEDADELFDRVLSSTLFSFRTNRRIFRGMIKAQGDARWQSVFDQILKNSRFAVPEVVIEQYMSHTFEGIIDYLNDGDLSRTGGLDPVGDINLRLAKKVRRLAIADGALDRPEALQEMADDFFPFPEIELLHWPRRNELPTESGGPS